MGLTQMHLTACALAGLSLSLNIFCSSNFIPVEEMTVIGYGFYLLHVSCNFATQVCLLSIVLIFCMELVLTDRIARYAHINANYFPQYLRNLMLSALLFSLVRFVLPGPVEHFSRFFKLGVFLNFAGTVVVAVDTLLQTPASPRPHLTIVENIPAATMAEVVEASVHQPAESAPVATVMRESSSSESTLKSFIPTKRHRTVMELHQTETSYLRSLGTIIHVYKEPLEKAVTEGRPILAPEDIKSVFGSIQDIADAHWHIHHDVSLVIDEWTEECCVGDVIKDNKELLTIAYPPYVNYFDLGKEILTKRLETNPQFAAFVENCYNNPESLKQRLDSLLIRPVQRLPSLLMLITDLQKRTPPHTKDYEKLGEAIADLKEVLSYINEDKRKTEGKMKIFDIVYEVTGCPVEIVSANRSYLGRVDVTTLTDGLYRQGERLALYLLTDVLEIAKWRTRSHGKSLLKHINLLPLSNIISIMDVSDIDDCTNMFAVRFFVSGTTTSDSTVHDVLRTEERVAVLQLIDDRNFKLNWMKLLSQQVAHAKGFPHKNDVVSQINPSDLLNIVKRNTKLYKKLKTKLKID